MVNHPNRNKKERAVLVTTTHRGVFFGYTELSDAEILSASSIALSAARNCLYWSTKEKGFIGLAVTGPSSGCRIGPAADITLRDITCVAKCSEQAVSAWEAAPWSK